jgi:hypothetical protein
MSNDKYEETFELKIFENENAYGQIIYAIKMINPRQLHETKSAALDIQPAPKSYLGERYRQPHLYASLR